MKREERKVYNSLKKTVTGDTLYVEIPTNWTHEARQAIHELLTVEKGMFATVIGPDCRTFKETIRYTHSSEATKATRQAQEVTDIDEVMKELRYTDCTWNGYKANEEEEPATAEPAQTESKEEKKEMTTLEKIAADMKTYYADRSAWNRGVATIAADLLGEYANNYGKNAAAPTMADLLNGADNWSQYSWGGSYLVYDGDIAELLCTPSELKRTRNGERRPNSREEWLDVQARALNQAARRIINSASRVCKEV